jgi:hypothetical protein
MIRRYSLPVYLLMLAGCPDNTYYPYSDASTDTVEISGVVEDYEKCWPTCLPAGKGLKVSLLSNSAISAETGDNGGFVLRGVPPTGSQFLLVQDPGNTYLPTIKAPPVEVKGVSLKDQKAYTLHRNSGIYGAANKEDANLDFAKNAVYFGQIYTEQGSIMELMYGVEIEPPNGATLRYVNCKANSPQTSCTGQPALAAPDTKITNTTGAFFLFSPQKITVKIGAKLLTDCAVESLNPPLSPGYITFGLHSATGSGCKRSKDQGTTAHDGG